MLNKMRAYLSKNQIAKYLMFTFVLSWAAWGILYLSSIGVISPHINEKHAFLFIVIGGSAPSFTAFVYTGLVYGKAGIKGLIKKILIWKVNPLWYAFALLYIPAIYYAPVLILKLFGGQYDLRPQFGIGHLLMLFIGQLYVGPLNEEFGWRGFVLPKMQKRFNMLLACILLGVIHASWHIPLFFVRGPYQFTSPFIQYLLIVICYSFVYAWLYNGTGGSLIPICLLHAQVNFNTNYFTIIFPSGSTAAYYILSNIIAFVPACIIIYYMLRPGYKKVAEHHAEGEIIKPQE